MTRGDDDRIAGVRLAHHYHRTDPELVWQVAVQSVPQLAASLRSSRP